MMQGPTFLFWKAQANEDEIGRDVSDFFSGVLSFWSDRIESHRGCEQGNVQAGEVFVETLLQRLFLTGATSQ